jgi:hypothetical protein
VNNLERQSILVVVHQWYKIRPSNQHMLISIKARTKCCPAIILSTTEVINYPSMCHNHRQHCYHLSVNCSSINTKPVTQLGPFTVLASMEKSAAIFQNLVATSSFLVAQQDECNLHHFWHHNQRQCQQQHLPLHQLQQHNWTCINKSSYDISSSSTTGSNASTALAISSIPAAQLDVYQQQ